MPKLLLVAALTLVSGCATAQAQTRGCKWYDMGCHARQNTATPEQRRVQALSTCFSLAPLVANTLEGRAAYMSGCLRGVTGIHVPAPPTVPYTYQLSGLVNGRYVWYRITQSGNRLTVFNGQTGQIAFYTIH